MVLAVNVPAGRSVLNVLVVVVVLPSVPLAVTVTLYWVDACNGHTVCQAVWPCSVPAVWRWPAVTLTFSILPRVTVTEISRLVFTFVLPFAGVIDTTGPVLATVFVPPVDDPCWLVLVDEEPEQAVASRARAPHTPVIASPPRRPLSRRRPVADRSLSRTMVLLWCQSVIRGAAATTASPPCGVLGRQRGCHEPHAR